MGDSVFHGSSGTSDGGADRGRQYVLANLVREKQDLATAWRDRDKALAALLQAQSLATKRDQPQASRLWQRSNRSRIGQRMNDCGRR